MVWHVMAEVWTPASGKSILARGLLLLNQTKHPCALLWEDKVAGTELGKNWLLKSSHTYTHSHVTVESHQKHHPRSSRLVLGLPVRWKCFAQSEPSSRGYDFFCNRCKKQHHHTDPSWCRHGYWNDRADLRASKRWVENKIKQNLVYRKNGQNGEVTPAPTTGGTHVAVYVHVFGAGSVGRGICWTNPRH